VRRRPPPQVRDQGRSRHITVLLLDGDEAGRKANEKVAGVIANVVWCRIVHLACRRQPDNVDRTELEQSLGCNEKWSLCEGEYKERKSCPELAPGSGRVFFHPSLGLHSLGLICCNILH
jgi:hypothetical protein